MEAILGYGSVVTFDTFAVHAFQQRSGHIRPECLLQSEYEQYLLAAERFDLDAEWPELRWELVHTK